MGDTCGVGVGGEVVGGVGYYQPSYHSSMPQDRVEIVRGG